jgi:hypothetical protein
MVSAAGQRKPKMPETGGVQNPPIRQPHSPRFRWPAAEIIAEGVRNRAAKLGLQRVPDGVLHGLEGVFGATPVGAAALGDVGLAPTATS